MKLYRPTLQKQPKTAKGYVACMTDQPHPADNEWNGRESREWVKFTDHAADLARADARIAELERECSQWRDELRIYRETENARIAELEADAARYRWLRKHHVNGPLIVDKYGCAIAYEAADNEVDTTRTKKKKTSE